MKTPILFILFMAGLNVYSFAQSPQLEIFGSEDPLECTLAFDIKQLQKNKDEESYQDALVTIKLDDGVLLEKNIRLKSRGIFRKDFCNLPPIMLNLKDTTGKSIETTGIKTIKLVTHCHDNKAYTQYVLKEYLVYKLYNLLTEQSFKVRLMKIRYIDTGSKKSKEYLNYGFVIEDVDRVAERNDAMEIDIKTLNREHLEMESMTRVAIFQFMIGNTDWSVPGLHNIKLLKSNDFTKTTPIPVPYDFDFCGFVNAPYSTPAEHLGIENVRIRYFRGICMSLDEYKAALQEFHDVKERVYQTLLEFEYIDDKTRKDITRFVDDFYKIIESDKLITSSFSSTCKDLSR